MKVDTDCVGTVQSLKTRCFRSRLSDAYRVEWERHGLEIDFSDELERLQLGVRPNLAPVGGRLDLACLLLRTVQVAPAILAYCLQSTAFFSTTIRLDESQVA